MKQRAFLALHTGVVCLLVIYLGLRTPLQGPVVNNRYAIETTLALPLLVANPLEYDAKRVVVAGYCNLEFEGNALFVSKQDSEEFNTSKGVWLSVGYPIPTHYQKFHGSYVVVEARFSALERGHFGVYQGTLEDITRVEYLPGSRQRARK